MISIPHDHKNFEELWRESYPELEIFVATPNETNLWKSIVHNMLL